MRKSNLQSRFSSTHKKENQSCIHLNTIAKSCLLFHLSYIIFPRSLSCACPSGVWHDTGKYTKQAPIGYRLKTKHQHKCSSPMCPSLLFWLFVLVAVSCPLSCLLFCLLSFSVVFYPRKDNSVGHIREEHLCWWRRQPGSLHLVCTCHQSLLSDTLPL